MQHADKNYYVIAYINCSAGVKALSDVICTSGNAEKIVRSAPADRNILFVPDQNLGAWVIERTGRPMDLWQGNCYVHVEFTARSIGKIREEYPERAGRRPSGVHLRGAPAGRRSLLDGKNGDVLPGIAGAGNHRRDRSRHAASVEEGNSRQDFHSRADGELLLRRMPVHENEHARESARRAAEHGSRRSRCPSRCENARKRRSFACWSSAGKAPGVSLPLPLPLPLLLLSGVDRKITSRGRGRGRGRGRKWLSRRGLESCHLSLGPFPFSLLPRCRDLSFGSSLVVLLLGVLFFREPRLEQAEEIFLQWLLRNSEPHGPVAPLTVVEIGQDAVLDRDPLKSGRPRLRPAEAASHRWNSRFFFNRSSSSSPRWSPSKIF